MAEGEAGELPSASTPALDAITALLSRQNQVEQRVTDVEVPLVKDGASPPMEEP